MDNCYNFYFADISKCSFRKCKFSWTKISSTLWSQCSLTKKLSRTGWVPDFFLIRNFYIVFFIFRPKNLGRIWLSRIKLWRSWPQWRRRRSKKRITSISIFRRWKFISAFRKAAWKTKEKMRLFIPKYWICYWKALASRSPKFKTSYFSKLSLFYSTFNCIFYFQIGLLRAKSRSHEPTTIDQGGDESLHETGGQAVLRSRSWLGHYRKSCRSDSWLVKRRRDAFLRADRGNFFINGFFYDVIIFISFRERFKVRRNSPKDWRWVFVACSVAPSEELQVQFPASPEHSAKAWPHWRWTKSIKRSVSKCWVNVRRPFKRGSRVELRDWLW